MCYVGSDCNGLYCNSPSVPGPIQAAQFGWQRLGNKVQAAQFSQPSASNLLLSRTGVVCFGYRGPNEPGWYQLARFGNLRFSPNKALTSVEQTTSRLVA